MTMGWPRALRIVCEERDSQAHSTWEVGRGMEDSRDCTLIGKAYEVTGAWAECDAGVHHSLHDAASTWGLGGVQLTGVAV